MAVSVGKKRRRAELEEHDQDLTHSSEDDATARALFQRAFEAKFKPLDRTKPQVTQTEPELFESDDSEDQDDWDGLSNDDEQVEVVQVQALDASIDDAALLREKKAFMSGRIPTSTQPARTARNQPDEDPDESEKADLKNDIALQRLLKESHLLDASTYNSTGADVQGKSRLKALDMRIQDLGGKTSHLSQKNMPLSHRRGIETKTVEREQKRRKNAADNGIILEKAKFAARAAKPREKGIGGPTVGKFQGGMLKLNSKDLKSIESVKVSSRGGRRGRGRGGGRGGRGRGH